MNYKALIFRRIIILKRFAIVLFCIILLCAGVYRINEVNGDVENTAASVAYRTVILDAGHGGEDGGAVAPDGTLEKDINLMISCDIGMLFRLFGVRFVPVRETDVSVCDPGLDTIRQRKYSDIMNRAALTESVPEAVFLSIHQNIYSESKYNGTQVFYSPNAGDSSVLAENIQNAVSGSLQPDNDRKIKAADSSIYLLHNAKTTSVLVECGFLSNPEELSKLKDGDYQLAMAYYIFRGTLNFLSHEKEL